MFELDNRDLASLLLMGVFLLTAFSRRRVRESFSDVARAFLRPIILVPLVLLVGHVAGLIYLGFALGIWDAELMRPTVAWFLTAVVAFFSIDKAQRDPRFVRKVGLRTVGIAVTLEFIANLYVLSLGWEIALAVVGVVLVLLAAVASTRPEHRPVATAAEALLGLLGLGVIGYSVRQLVINWSDVDRGGLALEFLLPIWMTLGLLPLLYVFALYAGYEGPARELRRADGTRLARLKAFIALLAKVRTRRSSLGLVKLYWTRQMVQADSVRGAMSVVQEMMDEAEARQSAAEAENQRLVDYAGVTGVDSEGRQLDRREFKETTKSLRWLATCHMGHYRQLGRYRPDMLTVIEDPRTFPGLPEDHGIHMHVTADGQCWWAWRRTITGWCFAIGAAEEPPDQWLYDGPEPPEGPPGHDPQWGDGPFDLANEPNW
ncbi:hypothetical protein ER308_20875 [Egibacter rhizosphaerae]|uniref:Uncharacterized protein n=1 Tax=Egibacter rhizosphaerae TaxID=1670831 RepID=A0A411YKP9_9ACTN|nr:hypothetical protein [Egibacter rhizosphaerae]QBI21767.1 hypothetical protein ER308_20875 [Egibacter rhizosphaerae]